MKSDKQIRIYRYEIKPNLNQIGELNKVFEQCAELWNFALSYQTNIYKETIQHPITSEAEYYPFINQIVTSARRYNQQTIQDTIPKIKELDKLISLNLLKSLHSQPYQEVLARLDKAFEQFFKGTRKRPRFKSRKSYKSITFTQYGSACSVKNIDGKNFLVLSKLGNIPINFHRPFPENCKIKQAIIKRSASGRWSVSFMVQADFRVKLPEPEHIIQAYDRGIKVLVASDSGEMVKPPRALYLRSKKLRKTSRVLSRKYEAAKRAQNKLTPKQVAKIQKKRKKNKYSSLIQNDILLNQETKKHPKAKVVGRSKRYDKAKVSRAKVYEDVANIRDDFTHKLSKAMVAKAHITVFENLLVSNMVRNKKLAKAIYDASWSSLKNKVVYKAESAGRTIKFVRPHNTSRECSKCHYIDKNNRLTQEEFLCLECGHHANADVDAAVVCKQRAIQTIISDFLAQKPKWHHKLAGGSTESLNGRGGEVPGRSFLLLYRAVEASRSLPL